MYIALKVNALMCLNDMAAGVVGGCRGSSSSLYHEAVERVLEVNHIRRRTRCFDFGLAGPDWRQYETASFNFTLFVDKYFAIVARTRYFPQKTEVSTYFIHCIHLLLTSYST